jgi:hypothetical protein
LGYKEVAVFHRNISIPWTFNEYPALSFCVAVLVEDGLRVAPFDRHPDGGGRLRTLGLDAQGWLAWFMAVLSQPHRQRRDLDPSALWVGGPEVRTQLHDRWLAYPHEQSVAFRNRVESSFHPSGPQEARELQRLARSAEVTGAQMQVYWVAYPAQVSYRPLETTLILGGPTPPTYRELLLHVMHPGEWTGDGVAFSGG